MVSLLPLWYSLITALFTATIAIGNTYQVQDAFIHSVGPYVPACAWSRLNSTIGGRLQRATPFASSCFEHSTVANKSYDPYACAKIKAEYLDPAIRSDLFGAYINAQWEACQAKSEQCTLNWLNPSATPPQICQQGAVPSYYIDVQDYRDVVAAFDFAQAENVPVTIKNTGHDYMGRSSGPNTLGIWTHHLKSVSYDAEFVPAGCTNRPSTSAVTFGSGVQFFDLLEFANEHNITIPGGAEPTVGIGGGYLQGGGHSPLSNIFGLAVDRVLEFEVVVPTGDLLVANDCQNSDLFFALRGGGGGTFGVVMSATTRALPRANLVTVSARITAETPIERFLEFVIPRSVQWSRDGWSGYIYSQGIFHLSKLDISTEEALAYMAPLQQFIRDELNLTLTTTTSSSYGEFHEIFMRQSTEGLPQCIPVFAASRLIPASTFTDSPTELLEVLMSLIKRMPVSFIFANAPYSYSTFPDSGPTSVTPAWRSSVWDVTFGQTWDYSASASEHELVSRDFSRSMDPLRAITPGGGAYGNEADIYEPNFEDAFWGSNYEQLSGIKQKYDPGHLLDCWRCVGWKGSEDPRYSCYF